VILKRCPLENLWLLGLELQQFAQLRGPLKPVMFGGDVDGLLIPWGDLLISRFKSV
jgi:hypothetical protein